MQILLLLSFLLISYSVNLVFIIGHKREFVQKLIFSYKNSHNPFIICF